MGGGHILCGMSRAAGRATFLSSLGAGLEYYDFIIYGMMAGYLSALFFQRHTHRRPDQSVLRIRRRLYRPPFRRHFIWDDRRHFRPQENISFCDAADGVRHLLHRIAPHV